jgi:2-polyprenyl-3-methyl-5-hydroxy-6-metoxy-1,4-benzoquinol methylase
MIKSFLSLFQNLYLNRSISGFIPSFIGQLHQINIDEISNDAYVRDYFEHLCKHSSYYVKIYADVLERAEKATQKNRSDIALLDYGAGLGLLGIFAAVAGFGAVSINEREEPFLDAAEKISSFFQLQNITFIPGELTENQSSTTWGKPDVLVATDVIEHLYSIDDFLGAAKKINNQLIFIFTTGSNPENYWKVKKLKKIQWRDEHLGHQDSDEQQLGGYAHESFLNLRKKMIAQYAPDLSADQISSLARDTRGLKNHDILIAIQQFKCDGLWPRVNIDDFNTCNPETGSWTEKIIPLKEYQSLFAKHNYDVHFASGFYDVNKKGIKSILASLANTFISIIGMKIAPFIFLTAKISTTEISND